MQVSFREPGTGSRKAGGSYTAGSDGVRVEATKR
jgi:hypothetical protein